jgi:outer membrane protein assembly factor BamD
MNKCFVEFRTSFVKTGLLIISLGTVTIICGCSKQKNRNELGYEELKQQAYADLGNKREDLASEYLEEIVTRFSDRQDISQHKLALAETYFKLGKFPSAYELYNNFAQFYPSDEKAEYAKYRAILSKFYQTLNPNCDQTTTIEATTLCKEYLDIPAYKKYASDIRDIQHTCEIKLIDKEVYVFNFYLNQKKYTAAQNRINTLEKEYLPKNPSLEARILYLKCQLAKKQRKNPEFKQHLEQLLIKFPDSQFTQLAQGIKNKPTDIFF